MHPNRNFGPEREPHTNEALLSTPRTFHIRLRRHVHHAAHLRPALQTWRSDAQNRMPTADVLQVMLSNGKPLLEKCFSSEVNPCCGFVGCCPVLRAHRHVHGHPVVMTAVHPFITVQCLNSSG